MPDDPMQVYRVYFVIDVSTLSAVPTEAQWQSLVNKAKTYPWAVAVVAAAIASQNFISAHKRAQGTGLMKYTLPVYEIDGVHKDDLVALLNTLATQYGVLGNMAQKIAGVHQYELRAAAVALGYSQAQANKINVTLVNGVGSFSRMEAINTVQQYIVDNNAIWHVA